MGVLMKMVSFWVMLTNSFVGVFFNPELKPTYFYLKET